jgi:PHD/YefM family antitoxin component YafN of YafNO toxin-antitoxin module
MGGQACVLYGAAEFSIDADIVLLASEQNLELLRQALRALEARRVALPPFDLQYLLRGHAIHFRCYNPDALKVRIDVMSVLRGVDEFDRLWARRVTFLGESGEDINVLSVSDLVQAKKTQRDKDWPMIRRLIEADYVAVETPTIQRVTFWLLESRTPPMLLELVKTHHDLAVSLCGQRRAIVAALDANETVVEEELEKEQKMERALDRRYWEPLRKELEQLRGMSLPTEEAV